MYDDEFGTTPGGGGVNGAINRGNSGSTLSRSQSAGAVATMAMNGNGDHSTDPSAGEAPQLPRTPG
ncbi:hypothetical protein NY486_23330, partial [Enterobacter hormaechei]|nr:hypothetical protein [Enterobacter hormaechei]